jgi:hypothetical protein
MSPLPLPSQTLARLQWQAENGHDDAKALLHLIAGADKRDQDVAEFLDSYSRTIAALCRRLEVLELVAGLRHPVEDAETTESDSVSDTAQRITDHAVQAGLTVQGWVKAFNAAQVDDSPVANALLVAESALADVAEGLPDSPTVEGSEPIEWAETRCAEALAAIRPVMRQHGIRTSEWPAAAPAPAPAAPGPVEPESEKCETCDGEGTIDETLGGWSTDNPAATCPDCDGVGEPRRLHRQAPAAPTPRPTALVEVVGNELPLLPGGEVDQVLTLAVIRKLAAWLDKQGDHASANVVRRALDR